ncbi:SDR family oxidoreductase [Candidatus Parcubacteria bacterium]|nr:SDR family oxidoreductase [Candidatus Parcubacteria bacterium]
MQELKNKTILVTGGAGFIGSHLCRKLLKESNNNNVICLDNFFTGSKKNIADLIDNKNFEVIRHDIEEPIQLEVEQIYNLACPASPQHYQFDKIKTLKTNVLGAINILDLAKQAKARVLQASTSEVYGDPLEHPQNEIYNGNVKTIGPRSCYDEGKRAAETLFGDYHKELGMDTRIVRIFNTYGPYMDVNDGRVVSNFIMQGLYNQDITIYGNGSQTRSFQYIDDLLDGIVKMMNNENNFYGPVNIGSLEEFTVKELAEIIIDMIPNCKSKIVYKELPQCDPKKRRPDISLAKKMLDWEPKIKLEEGLKKTIEYFKSIL